MFMKRVLRAAMMALVLSFSTTFMAQDCCQDCTCTFCADIVSCQSNPFYTDPTQCEEGGLGVCGIGTALHCSTFFENNTEGVVTDESQTTYGPGGCIPIDGGVGFLIAGGLGIGVIGIRRRKEELEVERD